MNNEKVKFKQTLKKIISIKKANELFIRFALQFMQETTICIFQLSLFTNMLQALNHIKSYFISKKLCFFLTNKLVIFAIINSKVKPVNEISNP